MNKKLIGIALALSIPLTAMAVEDMQAEVNKKVERLTKDLSLDAEQQVKVKAIFEQKEQKSKVLREEVHAQMQQVLTPEQLSKMEEKHKHHGHKKAKDCDK